MTHPENRFISWGFSSVIICLGVFVWITYSNLQITLIESKSVKNTLQSLRKLELVLDDMQKIESGQLGYLITGNKQELATYYKAIGDIQTDSASLYVLGINEPSRAQVIQQLDRLVRRKIAFADTLIRVKDALGYETAAALLKTGRGRMIMDSIRFIIYSLETADRGALRASNLDHLEKAKRTNILFLMLSGIFFAGFGIAYFILRKNLARRQIYQEELARLSSLVKQTSEAIISTNPAFIIQTWNQAAENLYGIAAVEAVGKNLNLVVKGHQELEEKEQLLQQLQKDGFFLSVFKISFKNGQPAYIESSITALKNEQGILDGYVVVHKDITGRIELENQLRKLNEQLEEKVSAKTTELNHIFERITDAFVALDNDSCFTYVNKKAGELFGFEPATSLGENILGFFPGRSGTQLYQSCQKAMKAQRLHSFEAYYHSLDKWIEHTLYPSQNGISIFCRDITSNKVIEEELFKSNQLFQNLAEISPVGIFRTNRRGDCLYVNDRWSAITGVETAAALGKNWFSSIHPEDRELVREHWNNKDLENDDFTFEFRLLRSTGFVTWVIGQAKAEYNPAGEKIGFVGSVTDISGIKLAEQEVLKANRLYEFISQVNQLMLKTKDRVTMFNEVCSIAIKYGRFRMAWIGLVMEEEHQVKPVAFDGFEDGYFADMIPISLLDIPEGNGPTGKAVREAKYYYCNDILHDPAIAPWRAGQVKRGYLSSISLPIFIEGKVIGTFSIYASEAFFFNAAEIQLLQEVSGNIGYALEKIEIEKKRSLAESGLRKLYSAVEQSSAAVIITDVNGIIEYVNPAFSTTTGYTREEAIGKDPGILKSGFSDPQQSGQLWSNLNAGIEWSGTFCNRKKNGELFWESATISPIVNEAGEITNHVAVKENITDKIIAEEQLYKEKELSDSIINSLPGLFYLYNNEGDFIRWNKNVETVSGYSGGEIKTMKPLDFFETSEQSRVKEILKALQSGQKMAGVEVLFFTKDKRRIPYYFNALSINYEGKPCIIGTGIDISDRKIAEEENNRLAMIASLTINAVILTDKEGFIQWINHGFVRITGYSFEEALGKKPGDLLQGPESDPSAIRYMSECLKAAKGFKIEIINYSKTGEKYWLDIEVVPIFNKANQLTGFMAIERDITDRKKAEEELLMLNQHLKERATELVLSNNELERFAYVASHDLQEPLRMVTSFMQLLQQDYVGRLDEKANKYINFATDGALRMKQLIMDLLEYSRVGTNKDVFVKTDMNKIVREVVGVFRKATDESSPEIIIHPLPEIVANKLQMAQLLQNLVGNAIKYNGSGKVVVTIHCTEAEDHFLFSVSDNGIGIKEEHFERIFILFQRLHQKSEFHGTGIGLTICKKIVERHGGKIWVTSAPGKGSVFYFTIPKRT